MDTLNEMLKQIAQETDGYKIGVPWKYSAPASAVFVVPLVKKTLIPRQYVTAFEVSQGLVVQDTGSISSIKVTNTSEIILFLSAGQILSGDTQERCVAISIVVRPGETCQVSVVCIHKTHGISSGAGMKVDSDAPRELEQELYDQRRNKSETQFQHRVWEEVNRSVNEIGLSGVLQDDLRSNLDIYRKTNQSFLSQIPEIPDQIGMAVFVGSGIYSLQVFDSPDSWRERRKALIEKELRGLNRAADGRASDEGVTPDEMTRLLRQFISQDLESEEVERGAGWQTLAVDAGSHSGEATILNTRVIHFTLGLKSASMLVENLAAECVHDAGREHGIKYGRGFVHADQVTTISLSLYESLAGLDYFRKSNAELFMLRAAGYLHDVGVPPDLKHNITGFNLLIAPLGKLVAGGTLSEADYRIILRCVLWHRGNDFSGNDTEVKLDPQEMTTARRLAAIIRIADGLNFPDGRPTMRVNASQERDALVIEACPSKHGNDLQLQIKQAMNKTNLLEEVLKAIPSLGINRVEIRKCSHENCK